MSRTMAMLAALVLSGSSVARAQHPAEPTDAGVAEGSDATAEASDGATATLTPPSLLQFVPAVLPSDIAIDAAGWTVLVMLTLDAAGKVTEAVEAPADTDDLGDAGTVTPIDPRVLSAVLEAARQLVFSPAMRGDTPIAARIQFEYRLDPPPPPDPATPEPTTAIAEPSDAPTTNGATQTTTPPASYAVTARTEAPPREVTRRELTAAQVGRIAGTRGDTLRAVEVLPGVARPPLNNGVVIVRGSSPQDTQVLVEGTPVLFLYHLGGLTSFFNAALLERVDFYPGNFSARFGRAMGGVIDVDVRSPRSDRGHGTLDLNFIDASLLLEAPIGDQGGVAIAARRSYIDLFFDAVVPDDAFDVIAAPLYWDYQAIGEYRVSPNDRLRLQAFGSRDQMRLVTSTPDEDNPDVRGNLGFSSEFHRGLLSWLHDYGGGARHELMVGLGSLNIDAAIGDLVTQHISAPTLFSRAEWHLPLASTLSVDTGWDVVGYRGRVSYQGPRYRNEDNDPSVEIPPDIVLDDVISVVRPAVFAELTWLPHERLRVIPGVRADYTSEAQDLTVDPRLATRWSVTDTTTLKAGVGRYSQAPELGAAFPKLGNPALNSASSIHTSVGIEQRIGDRLQLGFEGYAKYLWELPVNASTGPSPVNDGEGRIFGIEVSARYQHRRTFGYLAYTLSRSERSAHGEPYRLYDYDQPHILNLSAGYDLGRGWDVSGTFRLVSGNPQTPVIGAIYDANTDNHRPVYGTVNSARANTFHRLDLRIQKRWTFGEHAKLSLYLDLINAYNAQTTEATDYGFDYRSTSGVSGFPLLPVLGVRGEI